MRLRSASIILWATALYLNPSWARGSVPGSGRQLTTYRLHEQCGGCNGYQCVDGPYGDCVEGVCTRKNKDYWVCEVEGGYSMDAFYSEGPQSSLFLDDPDSLAWDAYEQPPPSTYTSTSPTYTPPPPSYETPKVTVCKPGKSHVPTANPVCPEGTTYDEGSYKCLGKCHDGYKEYHHDGKAVCAKCEGRIGQYHGKEVCVKCPEGSSEEGGKCYVSGKCPDGSQGKDLGYGKVQCYKCPHGTQPEGDKCHGGHQCPAGYEEVKDGYQVKCAACPQGSKLEGDKCHKGYKCPPHSIHKEDGYSKHHCYACPEGAKVEGDKCYVGEHCPEGYETKQDGYKTTCVRCPEGTQLKDGKCGGGQKCPYGYQEVRDGYSVKCVGGCPQGTEEWEGKCYESCPQGYEVKTGKAHGRHVRVCLSKCKEGEKDLGKKCEKPCTPPSGGYDYGYQNKECKPEQYEKDYKEAPSRDKEVKEPEQGYVDLEYKEPTKKYEKMKEVTPEKVYVDKEYKEVEKKYVEKENYEVDREHVKHQDIGWKYGERHQVDLQCPKEHQYQDGKCYGYCPPGTSEVKEGGKKYCLQGCPKGYQTCDNASFCAKKEDGGYGRKLMADVCAAGKGHLGSAGQCQGY